MKRISLLAPLLAFRIVAQAQTTHAFFGAAVLQEPELKLAALQPTTLALGHGKPLSGAALSAELQQLASRFGGRAGNRKAAVTF